MSSLFKALPIERLQPGRYQPRQTFDEEALKELAQSIRTQGLIEPLVVRLIAENQYEIIAGERRWRAAMLAGLHELPCVIGTYTDEQTAAVTLIENIQRQDLNLLEEADGYQRLIHEFHFSQDDISTLVGKSRSHIANLLRLLTLTEPVKQMLHARLLSLGHARMLVGLANEQQISLARQTHEQGLSVRQLEQMVRLLKTNTSTQDHPDSQQIHHLQTALSEQVGAPVQISSEAGQGGWLKIKFYDNDTLSGLLERMGLRYD